MALSWIKEHIRGMGKMGSKTVPTSDGYMKTSAAARKLMFSPGTNAQREATKKTLKARTTKEHGTGVGY